MFALLLCCFLTLAINPSINAFGVSPVTKRLGHGARKVAVVHYNSQKSSSQALFMSNRSAKEKGLSLKVIAVFVVGVAGIFGTGFMGTLGKIGGDVAQSTIGSANSANKPSGEKGGLKSEAGMRGEKTRMTRGEVNGKLSQVPLFYITADGVAVYTETSPATSAKQGFFFLDKGDVDVYLASVKDSPTPLKVTATTMDKVYYPLIIKKSKPLMGVAGSSDPAAAYSIKAMTSQITETDDKWKGSHIAGDAPLFRVTNLAFQKKEGLEIPLFLRKEDAISSYNRLQEGLASIKTDATAITKPKKEMQVQTTSLQDVVFLFSSGGFESRALEIYPSVDNIEAAFQYIK